MGTYIKISDIKVSEKQLRKVDKSKVEKHRKDLEEGKTLYPIDVVQINEKEYCICGNGRHRYFGAIAAGYTMIEVEILNK